LTPTFLYSVTESEMSSLHWCVKLKMEYNEDSTVNRHKYSNFIGPTATPY